MYKTTSINESISFDVIVKPHLSELKMEITEYDFPDECKTTICST